MEQGEAAEEMLLKDDGTVPSPSKPRGQKKTPAAADQKGLRISGAMPKEDPWAIIECQEPSGNADLHQQVSVLQGRMEHALQQVLGAVQHWYPRISEQTMQQACEEAKALLLKGFDLDSVRVDSKGENASEPGEESQLVTSASATYPIRNPSDLRQLLEQTSLEESLETSSLSATAKCGKHSAALRKLPGKFSKTPC